ncbi:MAG TPA: hypothetical protein VEZ41_16615 [Allosphingosinicella sp.]|nr:hypothetical protein [Allosphingosinicella sp.]
MTIPKLLAIAAVAAAMVSVPAQAQQRRDGEQRLQHELRGRVAGEPVNCINLRNTRNSRIIDRTAIIFDAGGTLYVNRPRAGAESLSRWDAQVVRPFGSQLCSIDTVQMVDATSGTFRGIVFLGDFVPYRRVRN